jgi:hypothetical protein
MTFGPALDVSSAVLLIISITEKKEAFPAKPPGNASFFSAFNQFEHFNLYYFAIKTQNRHGGDGPRGIHQASIGRPNRPR